MELVNQEDGANAPSDLPELDKPSDEPRDLFEWLWRVREYEKFIYVCEDVDGTIETVPLSQCSPRRWAFWVAMWMNAGILPVRIMQDGEG